MLADSGSLSLKTGADVDVTGDAIINNRKKKLIPSYELQVKGTWSGRCLPYHHKIPIGRKELLLAWYVAMYHYHSITHALKKLDL